MFLKLNWSLKILRHPKSKTKRKLLKHPRNLLRKSLNRNRFQKAQESNSLQLKRNRVIKLKRQNLKFSQNKQLVLQLLKILKLKKNKGISKDKRNLWCLKVKKTFLFVIVWRLTKQKLPAPPISLLQPMSPNLHKLQKLYIQAWNTNYSQVKFQLHE